MQIWSEPLQKFRLAGQGHVRRAAAADPADRERLATYFDPLPFWYAPLEDAADRGGRLSAARDHAAADGRCTTRGIRRTRGCARSWPTNASLHESRHRRRSSGLADDDWVWVESPHGRIRCRIRTMEGVEPSTVWTWNAVGKQAGAWGLANDAPEATTGFLLNHLIAEHAAEGRRRCRAGCPNPIRSPGRRRGSTCACGSCKAAPQRDRRRGRCSIRCRRCRSDASLRRPACAGTRDEARPRHRSRHLRRLSRLRDRVQGVERRVGDQRAADRLTIPTAPIRRACGSTASATTKSASIRRRRPSISRCRACIARTPTCVTVCPTGASYKREDGIVLVDQDRCMGCNLCAWACPYGARELDRVLRHDEEVHAVRRPRPRRALPEHERQPACVLACPTHARHFGDFEDPGVEGVAAHRGARRIRPAASRSATSRSTATCRRASRRRWCGCERWRRLAAGAAASPLARLIDAARRFAQR